MKKSNPAIFGYLIIMFILTYGLGILEIFFQTGKFYDILQKGFTVFPVVTALVVHKLTREQNKSKLSLKVWKNRKMWAFCAFVPAILIALGASMYFCIFREEYSKVFTVGKIIGNDASMTISNPVVFAIACIIISAFCIPIQLLELGEEVGWRDIYYGIRLKGTEQKKQYSLMVLSRDWYICR